MVKRIEWIRMGYSSVVKAGLFSKKGLESPTFSLYRNFKGFEIDQKVDYSFPEDHELVRFLARNAGVYRYGELISRVPEAAELLHAGGASCETCAHYLAFTDADFPRLGASLKTAPVVKGAAEREGLWRLLASGAVDFVASDHAPAPEEEKNTGNPWTAYGGIPGTGTMLPYLLSEGLLSGRLSLPRFLDATGGAASRRYGLSARKGSIAVGKDADLVLVDPSATTRIEGGKLLSKGKITPFEGMRLTGRILVTYVRGAPVYRAARGADEAEAGDVVAQPGSGKFLTWGYR